MDFNAVVCKNIKDGNHVAYEFLSGQMGVGNDKDDAVRDLISNIEVLLDTCGGDETVAFVSDKGPIKEYRLMMEKVVADSGRVSFNEDIERLGKITVYDATAYQLK